MCFQRLAGGLPLGVREADRNPFDVLGAWK